MAREKHALIVDTVRRIDEERASLEVELAELPDRIKEARVEALRQAPTQASGGLGSEVQKLIEREGKATRRLAALVAEREAALVVEAEEAEKKRAEQIRHATAAATAARDRELAAWSEAGELLGKLVAVYDESIVPSVQELEEIRDNLKRAGVADVDGVAGLLPSVRPVPLTAWSFLALLWEVAADPGQLARGDIDGRLGELVPDMRGRQRLELRGVETLERPFTR